MPAISPLLELARLYLAMVQSAEDDLSYAEREAVTDSLHGRYAYLDRAEVQNVVLEVLAVQDGTALQEAVRQVVDTLGTILSGEEKAEVLEDLVSVARADGVVLVRERRLLTEIAAHWAVPLPPDVAEPATGRTDGAAWDALHHLAFIYLVFAHAPDSDFSEDERQVILNKLQEWAPNLDAQDVHAVLERAVDRYALGSGHGMLTASIEAVKSAFPAAQRKAALHDLVQIANADGVFLDSEEDLLNDLMTAWDLDPFADFG